jgi:AraC-like DNA-binding protein
VRSDRAEGADGCALFRFFPVSPPLGRFIAHLFASFLPEPARSRICTYRVPEIAAELVFAIGEADGFARGRPLADGRRASLFLQPAHLKMLRIPATFRETVGAALRPAGLRLLVPNGAQSLGPGSRIPLEEVWGPSARQLLDRLMIEASAERRVELLRLVLTERALEVEPPHATAARALRLIESAYGNVHVDEVAATCGVTTRTLHTLFTREVGLAPKQVARIVRVRRALELVQAARGPLSRISLASAFSDQAHLSREFRRLLGVTPRALHREISRRDAAPLGYASERELLSRGLLVLRRSEPAATRRSDPLAEELEADPTLG